MSRRSPKGDASREHPGQLSLFGGTVDDEPGPPTATAPPPVERAMRSERPVAAPDPEAAGPQAASSEAAKSEDLAERVGRHLDMPVLSLTLTRNRTRIVSARPERRVDGSPAGIHVRIHRCFAHAEDRVVRSVADFLAARSQAARKNGLGVIREHFRRHGQEDNHRPRNLRSRGEHFDLEKLRDRVNEHYFDGRLEVGITWGRNGGPSAGKGRRRRRRKGSFSIRLGSYDERLRLVRIHPVLDRADVPEYVVESIVYHEMLHAVVPPTQGARRRSVHPPEFRRLEKLYARHDEAEAWLHAHVERLARLR